MSEIRCPMCSKPNPPDAEECQFCGARIKPLIIDPSDTPGFLEEDRNDSPPEEDSGDDWLQNLRPVESEDASQVEDVQSEPSSSGEDSTPDAWMDRLRAESQPAEQGPPDIAAAQTRDLSDTGSTDHQDSMWMDSFRSRIAQDENDVEEPSLPEDREEPVEENGEEWLSRLRSGVVVPPGDEAVPPVEDEPTGDALDRIAGDNASLEDSPDDGIQGLRSGGFEEAPETGLGLESGGEFGEAPDWLSRLSQGETPEPDNQPPEEKASGDVEDWLSGLDAADTAGEDAQPPAEAERDRAPDWLSGLDAADTADEDAQPPAEAERDRAPDWLSGLEAADAPEAHGQPSSELEPGGVEDWLGSLDAAESPETAKRDETEAEEGAVPGWLRGFVGEEDGALPGSADSGTDDLPEKDSQPPGRLEWFESNVEDGGESAGVDEDFEAFASISDAAQASDTPEWLRKAFEENVEPGVEDEPGRLQDDFTDDEPDAGGLPQWFSGSKKPAVPPKPEAPEEGPIQAEAGKEVSSEMPEGSDAKRATPKWLQDIIDESKVDVESELESVLSQSTGDQFFSDDELEEEVSEIESSPYDEAFDDGGVDAWLDSSVGDMGVDVPGADLEAADLPDWLQDARAQQGAATGGLQPPDTGELPGDDSVPGEEQVDLSDDQEEDEEIFSSLELREYSPHSVLEDQSGVKAPGPDTAWLDAIEDTDGEETDTESPIDSAQMPDWLSEVHSRQTKETTMLSMGLESEAEESLREEDSAGVESGSISRDDEIAASGEQYAPSWLDDLETGEDEEDAQAVGGESEAGVEGIGPDSGTIELPGWMSGMKQESAGSGPVREQDSIESYDEPFKLDEMKSYEPVDEPEPHLVEPDWLDSIPEQEDEPADDQDASIAAAEMPDWLSQVQERQSRETSFLTLPDDEDEGELEEPAADEEAIEGREPGVEKPDSEPRSRPMWLEDLPDTPLNPPSAPAFVTGELSDGGEPEQEFNLEEVRASEWLEKIQLDKEADAEDGREPIDLARATLPEWLEAMRPAEGVPSTDKAQSGDVPAVETAGPLAGIAGALSAEPAVAAQHRAQTGMSVLNVTDEDYARSDLFSRLIADEETELQPIPRRRGFQKQLRWAVSALLLLAVFIPSFFGFPSFSLPVKEPADLASLYSMVDSLPVEEPALVVYDVEAGYAAEMEAAASPVLYHLLGRRIQVATLSTDVTGPALAERAIRRISLPFVPAVGEDYVHLGYLSGGASGIQLFVSNPSRAGLDGYLRPEGVSAEGYDVWAAPMLSNVTSLSDFSMAVVVVNDAERARIWIEQAGPLMEDSFLVMIVSNGLEPVVRPYYEGRSAEVDAILTGIPAAAAYDMRFQRTGGAAALWNPYNAAATAMFAVLSSAFILSLYRLIMELKKKAENGS